MAIDFENAEVIEARDTPTGVAREYEIVRQRLGADSEKWHLLRQELHPHNGRTYDVLIMTNDKEERVFCFDITHFFGQH